MRPISRARGLLIRLVAERSAVQEMSCFFDPGIAARIRDAEHRIRVGRGEACEGAFLIFDIRGFTALSYEFAPNELMALLAEYQARLIPIIQKYGGSNDKFLGDGMRPSPKSIAGTRPDVANRYHRPDKYIASPEGLRVVPLGERDRERILGRQRARAQFLVVLVELRREIYGFADDRGFEPRVIAPTGPKITGPIVRAVLTATGSRPAILSTSSCSRDLGR
jgi:hypothetical protein